MTAPETTRRAIMAGVAAMPVAALSAIAGAVSNPDPIFAAIERHKAAEARFSAACGIMNDVAARKERRIWRIRLGRWAMRASRALRDLAEWLLPEDLRRNQ